jgi:hypothetical protein
LFCFLIILRHFLSQYCSQFPSPSSLECNADLCKSYNSPRGLELSRRNSKQSDRALIETASVTCGSFLSTKAIITPRVGPCSTGLVLAFAGLAKAMSKPTTTTTTTTNVLDVAYNSVRIYCDADTIIPSLVLPSPDTFSFHLLLYRIRREHAALSDLPLTPLRCNNTCTVTPIDNQFYQDCDPSVIHMEYPTYDCPKLSSSTASRNNSKVSRHSSSSLS